MSKNTKLHTFRDSPFHAETDGTALEGTGSAKGQGKGGRGRRGREALQRKKANVKWRDKNSRLPIAERFLLELDRNEMRRAFINNCAVRDLCEWRR